MKAAEGTAMEIDDCGLKETLAGITIADTPEKGFDGQLGFVGQFKTKRPWDGEK